MGFNFRVKLIFVFIFIILVAKAEQPVSFDNLFNSGRNLIGINNNKALKVALESIVLARKEGNKENISRGYRLLGYIYMLQGQSSRAIENYLKALQVNPGVDASIRVEVYISLADAFRDIRNYERVIEYSENAIALSIKIENYDLLAKSYYYISSAYRLKNEIEIAQYFNFKIQAILSNLKDKDQYRLCYNHAGLNFAELEMYDSAIFYFRKILEFDKSREAKALSFANSGLVFLQMKEYDKAIQMIDLSLQEKDSSILGESYIYLTKAYLGKGDHAKAKEYLNFAILNKAPVPDLIEVDSLLGNLDYVALRESYQRQVEEANNELFVIRQEVDEIVARNQNVTQPGILTDWKIYLILAIAALITMMGYFLIVSSKKSRLNKQLQDLSELMNTSQAKLK